MFVLIYTNEGDNTKRFNARKYYLPKNIMKSYNVIINEKNFYDHPIDSGIKQYEEIRKVEQDEDYAKGCLWDYDYTKNHYILIAVDLSRQKELDGDPNAFNKYNSEIQNRR